jgi:hypothetical protein
MFMIRKMKEMSEKKMAFKDDRDEIFGGREGGHAIVLVAKKEGVGDTGGVVEKEGFGTGIGSDSANESKDHHLHSRSLQHIHLSGNGHGKQREVDPAIKNYDDAWFTVGALDPTSGKLMLKGAQGGAATSSGGLELGLGFSGQSLMGDHKVRFLQTPLFHMNQIDSRILKCSHSFGRPGLQVSKRRACWISRRQEQSAVPLTLSRSMQQRFILSMPEIWKVRLV